MWMKAFHRREPDAGEFTISFYFSVLRAVDAMAAKFFQRARS